MRDSVSLYPCHCLILSLFLLLFFIWAILINAQWYLWGSSSEVLSPLVFCPVNSICVGVLELLIYLLTLGRQIDSAWVLLLLPHGLETPWSLFVSHLLLITVHHFLFSKVLKSVVSYNLLIFIWFSGKFQLLLFHLACKWKSILD